ncbi:MAG: trimethylamine methyltransferase family protein [Anaerolineales bacterium]
MTLERQNLAPIVTRHKLQFLTDHELTLMQEGTLHVLEKVGVRFSSEKALAVFEEHGADVNHETGIVKIPADLVTKAMASVPRYFEVGARDSSLSFSLQKDHTYFCPDGCGVEVVDFASGEMRPSTKADVARMARVVDYLGSMAFFWPPVSAQDCGVTSMLHELDAAWNNTVKHVQSVTLMGERVVKYALDMAEVIAGSREALRESPIFSAIICTIAPLVQDSEGIEGAMLLAKAGIPVTFLAMPTLGTTAPATLAGSFIVADAEVISATVLLQLVAPGTPVSHSVMHGWADPRTGNYVSYPLDARARYAAVNIAHHWKMPSFGGAFGTESHNPGTWQSAAEVALDPALVSLAGAEWVTGIGLNRSYTLLHAEAILLDDDLYHRARYALADMEVTPETMALDVIEKVGPGEHFLAEKHTRKFMRQSWVPGLNNQLNAESKYRDPVEVAREKIAWILDNYQVDPLPEDQQRELKRILAAADQEIKE